MQPSGLLRQQTPNSKTCDKDSSPIVSLSTDHDGFVYQGVTFNQNTFEPFIGLNAVDTRTNVELIYKTLAKFKIRCTRMGAYKPRTQADSFQGLGKECLEYVFELAGKYDIKIIAMEVTHDRHIEEIDTALRITGNPTGVMLQVGTRNAQNFELLKAVGSQDKFPVLYKRGFGITLQESLAACEYISYYGNPKVIFCLRGVKSMHAAYHRNMVDFSQINMLHRLTNMPVCIDPSHAVGNLEKDQFEITDIAHATAQGIVSGANMILVDIHPNPKSSLVDAKQALELSMLDTYIQDIQLCRKTYIQRQKLYCNV